jgi:DNA-binding transcriptional regulator YhcF (GntR family)
MSSQLNVSHATVLQAYANLEDQGLIRAGRSPATTCTRPRP